jgi:hypothetical protein
MQMAVLPNEQAGLGVDEENRAVFASLCQFVWIQGEFLPLIYDLEHEVYARKGITRRALAVLKEMGLISVEQAGYVKKGFGQHARLFYFGNPTKIRFPKREDNQLDLGHVLFTNKGKALAAVVQAGRNQEFYEYVIQRWFEQGLITSSILSK